MNLVSPRVEIVLPLWIQGCISLMEKIESLTHDGFPQLQLVTVAFHPLSLPVEQHFH